MSASLVGSEMCIRDSPWSPCHTLGFLVRPHGFGPARWAVDLPGAYSEPVSYTHLTLPTICSV
eukprot:10485148-Alexandrium_andersonii.AAC.1